MDLLCQVIAELPPPSLLPAACCHSPPPVAAPLCPAGRPRCCSATNAGPPGLRLQVLQHPLTWQHEREPHCWRGPQTCLQSRARRRLPRPSPSPLQSLTPGTARAASCPHLQNTSAEAPQCPSVSYLHHALGCGQAETAGCGGMGLGGAKGVPTHGSRPPAEAAGALRLWNRCLGTARKNAARQLRGIEPLMVHGERRRGSARRAVWGTVRCSCRPGPGPQLGLGRRRIVRPSCGCRQSWLKDGALPCMLSIIQLLKARSAPCARDRWKRGAGRRVEARERPRMLESWSASGALGDLRGLPRASSQ